MKYYICFPVKPNPDRDLESIVEATDELIEQQDSRLAKTRKEREIK